jgi:molecular chaperone IbpA
MRTYDFTPLWRSSIGFDRVFDLLNDNSRLLDGQDNWPPYDIARTGDDTYRITLALAGFSPEEVSITAQQNFLTVAGQRAEAPNQEFLHQGIAARPFEHKFSLEDHVEVEGASFENGLLQVDLVRRIPEAMKPRRIAIGQAAGTSKPAKGKTVEHVRAA